MGYEVINIATETVIWYKDSTLKVSVTKGRGQTERHFAKVHYILKKAEVRRIFGGQHYERAI